MAKKKPVTNFNSKEFKDLEKKWYAKLEKTGFVDVEINEPYLQTYRTSGSKKYGKYSAEWQLSKIAYYEYATQFLNEHDFESKLDKVVWEYHSNGISVRDIAKTLIKVKIKTNRQKIWLKVRALRNEMKVKYLK